nr:phage tail terminator-like protein [Bradyrhizobium brasilense]
MLQTQAARAAGFPTLIKYEGVTFTPPTPLVAWARMVVTTTLRRPLGIGTDDSKIDGGLLLVDLFFPVNKGTKAVEDMADAVVDAFPIGPRLVGPTLALWVPNAYRSGVIETPTDLQVPVTVSWRCATN